MVVCSLCSLVFRLFVVAIAVVFGIPLSGFGVKYYRWEAYRRDDPSLGADPVYSLTFWTFSRDDMFAGMSVVAGIFAMFGAMYLFLYLCTRVLCTSNRGHKNANPVRV